MIVGKDSAKIGFKWFGAFAIKLFTAFATIAYMDDYPVVGIVGILSLGFFVYEQIKVYNELSK